MAGDIPVYCYLLLQAYVGGEKNAVLPKSNALMSFGIAQPLRKKGVEFGLRTGHICILP